MSDEIKIANVSVNVFKYSHTQCGDTCISLNDLIEIDLSDIESKDEFIKVLNSQLIDVKNRQTLGAYPTLRMLYDRYNLHPLDFTNVDSSRFDYFDMDNFGNAVGNYWVDLIEQVVPSTTIWKANYVYGNTAFDQQVYKYKSYTTHFCEDPSRYYPFNSISNNQDVSVNIEIIEDNPVTKKIDESTICSGVWLMENKGGSEFIGTVSETSLERRNSVKVINNVVDAPFNYETFYIVTDNGFIKTTDDGSLFIYND